MTRLVRSAAFVLAAAIALVELTTLPLRAAPLPALGADASRISVSGLSAGGYMAGQFAVAYSKLVLGAGIVAGGPYGCALAPGSDAKTAWLASLSANALRAQEQCMSDHGTFYSAIPAAAELLAHAKGLETKGAIDALSNLRNHKIYLFWGGHDERVVEGVVKRAAEFYQLAGVPERNIAYVSMPEPAHAFITEKRGQDCGTKGTPWLNRCGYDQAGAILSHLYGPLKPPGMEVESSFVSFDQTATNDATLAESGMAYIPTDCQQHAGCGVHVVFHGCEQGGDAFQTFVKNSGFARWAESNRLIVLFPRVRAVRLNPKGCWDWWGYTNRQFLERDGAQLSAIREMVDQLMATPKS